jgi:hypothetical protein
MAAFTFAERSITLFLAVCPAPPGSMNLATAYAGTNTGSSSTQLPLGPTAPRSQAPPWRTFGDRRSNRASRGRCARTSHGTRALDQRKW